MHLVERYTRTGPDTVSYRGDDFGSDDLDQAVELHDPASPH